MNPEAFGAPGWLAEQVADSAEIARAFLPHGGHEEQGGVRGERELHHHASESEESSQAPAVIGDPRSPDPISVFHGGHIGAGREHRIEVCRNDQGRGWKAVFPASDSLEEKEPITLPTSSTPTPRSPTSRKSSSIRDPRAPSWNGGAGMDVSSFWRSITQGSMD